MSSALDEISGDSLCILLLGSYDPLTKNLMRKIRTDLNREFNRYSCYTVLLENIDVHKSRMESLDLFVFIEPEVKYSGTVSIVHGAKILEVLSFGNENELKQILAAGIGAIDITAFSKLKEFEKLVLLVGWADIVYLIRRNTLTRGGELIEATYLLIRSDINQIITNKMEFFIQQRVLISTMLKELIDFGNIRTYPYTTYANLMRLLVRRTNNHISRLKTFNSKFGGL